MTSIVPFAALSINDVQLAGGKGAALAELQNCGFPVPPGFVVTTECFDGLLKQLGIVECVWEDAEQASRDGLKALEIFSTGVRQKILTAKLPEQFEQQLESHFAKLGAERVAVRSSATAEDSQSAAWAGMLDSYLNVEAAQLLESILKCFSSLFNARALQYRFEKGLAEKSGSLAVVVQQMVPSEKSGIAFSLNPITSACEKILIEAACGLGDNIVSGRITPSRYEFDRKTSAVARNLSEPSVLSEMEAAAVGQTVLKIEEHFKLAVDVEWAMASGGLFVLQARPITAIQGIASQALSRSHVSHFRKSDYLLSFWCRGVSVFVTDLHTEAYRALEVLYLIDNGVFKQYFTKSAYLRALDHGVTFYGDSTAFANYRRQLQEHCQQFEQFFENEIAGKQSLSTEIVENFFARAVTLCGEYRKMNFEFTDKAFSFQQSNEVIRNNLAAAASFKDEIRAFMNRVLFEPAGYTAALFNVLARQLRIPRPHFDNLTRSEIIRLLDGGKVDLVGVESRQECFAQHYEGSKFWDGSEAKDIVALFEEATEERELLTGQGASAGTVSGRVKIISVDYSDLAKLVVEIESMNAGAILVAETTAPELMLACKKAAAIVTDMGGLMSHAAIVSREFNIPCVVGTGNASRVLRDGDLVEVNGDEGLVRVLKRQP